MGVSDWGGAGRALLAESALSAGSRPAALAEDGWAGRHSGRVVRPYAITGGRTEPADRRVLSLVAVVRAGPADAAAGLSPEQRAILARCERPVTVADLVSDLALPLGVVRVLLADLVGQGRIDIDAPGAAGSRPGLDVLQEVLRGLRAL